MDGSSFVLDQWWRIVYCPSIMTFENTTDFSQENKLGDYSVRWRLKSPASQLFAQPFVQAQIKQNIKATRDWPPVTGGFPSQRLSNAENVSIWWRHHEISSALNYWVNSLRPSDAIWRHRSGSTLAQVMACCLTAPSHYLNQRWLIISKVLWHSSEGNFIRAAIN